MENCSRKIELLEQDADHFSLYVNWLYTSRISSVQKGVQKGDQDDDNLSINELGDLSDDEWEVLAGAYQLGGFLQDHDFRDATIDAMIQKKEIADNDYYVDLVSDVYAGTSSESPHRKHAVDLAIKIWHQYMFDTLAKREFPAHFIVDVLVAAGCKLRDGVQRLYIADFFANADPCAYHEHTVSNTPCYKKMRHF